MALVAKGVSRQEAHEQIRVLSHQASAVVKLEGKSNDLVERIKGDQFFASIHGELNSLLDAKTFIGRAPQQVEKYLRFDGEVEQVLKKYRSAGQITDKTSGAGLKI